MVGKKPAKINSGNKIKPIDIPGKATFYIAGFKAERNICPTCGKKTKSGIVYEYQGLLYCARGCIAVDKMVL
ncbi:MAG: hypothetical protein FJZ43_04095 [Candidatus Staskawiczbacteria bacterium]|nr:hypothetical protein [Candidatus Staskawiczbacteria bacterium]